MMGLSLVKKTGSEKGRKQHLLRSCRVQNNFCSYCAPELDEFYLVNDVL